MKKWKLYAPILAAILFFALNVYLIVKDDSKVERTVFVKEWTEVKKQNITETFQTKGVIKPREEYPVYYGREKKEFQKFLVREGDTVTAGTPLLEYTTPELDADRADLEAEKSQTEGEIAGIDEYIRKLESYQATIPKASPKNETDKELESELEQEIYEQESEKKKLEEQIKTYDAKINNMTDGGTGTIASETDGVVKHVDQNLGEEQGPIITIASSQPWIEGVLSENQLKKTEPGMKIQITSPDLKKPIDGTLERVNINPTEEPTVKTKNYYLYNAVMEEETDKLVNGSKVGVSVITAEAKGVPAVPEHAVQQRKAKPFVYRLTSKGQVNKQNIAKGLSFDGKQEIKSGVKLEDVVILEPDNKLQNHSLFITPLDMSEIKKSSLKKLPKKEIVRYLLIGLLEK
ncbi:efflux RND transporter periplasmic adaptor subunit [Bacillus sp. CECT 9360]|uniref:efflux RND transporter periplasmic adaptor subunit n=1 Tax=Bacillus sp. CECT 9360 TaxID=2845821 RepID=UPI001E3ACB02|nr:efflux RND transporter periplasmic adaptor subunit [Bacillus sp. CECT 9360]CAH0347212.1 Putative efflux system component YknX [Bacillus sp. CECT 9360]